MRRPIGTQGQRLGERRSNLLRREGAQGSAMETRPPPLQGGQLNARAIPGRCPGLDTSAPLARHLGLRFTF
jgi:hypothetical protein